MRECAVCDSKYRAEIERVLFTLSPDQSATEELERISKEYDIPVTDLQRHALFHSSLGSSTSDSIVRQIKMRETDMLAVAASDFMNTLQIVGQRIRKKASSDDEVAFERCLTKPMVELYTGCGSELRSHVKTIADINQMLNGPKDEGTAGLFALAEALRSSRTGSDSE